MRKSFESLSRNAKLAIGGGAAIAGIILYKRITAAQTAPGAYPVDNASVVGRMSQANRIIKEHAIAAKDDIKKEAGEVAAVLRTHATLASRDASTAKREVTETLHGKPVSDVKVFNTPPVATNVDVSNVNENVRTVRLERPGRSSSGGTSGSSTSSARAGAGDIEPGRLGPAPTSIKQQVASPSLLPGSQLTGAPILESGQAGAASRIAKSAAVPPPPPVTAPAYGYEYNPRGPIPTSTSGSPSRGSSGPSGYEPATFSESAGERMHSTTYSNRPPSPSVVDRAQDAKRVVEEHARGASADVSQASGEVGTILSTHKALAGRDISQAGREVKAALRGEVPSAVTVRDTPNLLSEAPRDRIYQQSLSPEGVTSQKVPAGGDASGGTGSEVPIGVRLQAAKAIIGEHARAAKEDVVQAARETAAVVSEHGRFAGRDVATAREETRDAFKGSRPASNIAVRDTPPLVGSGAVQGRGGAPESVRSVPK